MSLPLHSNDPASRSPFTDWPADGPPPMAVSDQSSRADLPPHAAGGARGDTASAAMHPLFGGGLLLAMAIGAALLLRRHRQDPRPQAVR